MATRRPAAQVVTPESWRARPARAAMAPRGPLSHLVLHHAAFPTAAIGGTSFAAEARHMREIQRWHFDRGFSTIGYHFVVSPAGRIFRGRPLDRMGAHVQGHNRGTVGICLMGNFELERPAEAALAALEHARRLVPGGARAPLRPHRGHRGHGANACPGRHLLAALGDLANDESRLAAALVEPEERRSS